MKQEARKWLARSAFVALVAIGTLIAGPRFLAADQCTRPEQVGTCPPLDAQSCIDACILAGYPDGGTCGAVCCTCKM